eukprot:m.240232 g.240232  ORF g.240232 m.240232 type:complete len:122 (-) comp54398_c0_seq13:273-638(-)
MRIDDKDGENALDFARKNSSQEIIASLEAEYELRYTQANIKPAIREPVPLVAQDSSETKETEMPAAELAHNLLLDQQQHDHARAVNLEETSTHSSEPCLVNPIFPRLASCAFLSLATSPLL